MANQDTVFSSNIKYSGIFSFSSFYKFCYDWLSEEAGFDVSEDKYAESISGDSKKIDINWSGSKGFTDYFKGKITVSFNVSGLKDIEIANNGGKIKTNKGGIKIGIKGILIKDPQGKFEMTAFNQFLRSIYEKWVITSRIGELEGKIAGACDEFLAQSKAFLDLEGRK